MTEKLLLLVLFSPVELNQNNKNQRKYFSSCGFPKQIEHRNLNKKKKKE